MANERYLSASILENIDASQVQEIRILVSRMYNIDFGHFAPSILKSRLAIALNILKVTDIKEFLARLQEKSFFEKVLGLILVEIKEFYRDPTLWIEIKEHIIKDIQTKTSFKIWFPDCASGEELFSLAMILKKSNLLEKVSIFASNISNEKIAAIKTGIYDKQNGELDFLNFKRADMLDAYSDYFKPVGDKCRIETSLIDRVTFFVGDSIETCGKVPNVNLIMFRNAMIYYTHYYKEQVLSAFAEKLLPKGYIVIGTKETIGNHNLHSNLKCINEIENVYQKL